MATFRHSYFQITFGQGEAYQYPERTCKRLQCFCCDAVEVYSPKGRCGTGFSLQQYLERMIGLTGCDDVGVQLDSRFPNGFAIPGRAG